MFKVMIMECVHIKDKECEYGIINVHQCNVCLTAENSKMIKSLEKRILALEKTDTKKLNGKGNKSNFKGKQ